MVRDGRNPNIDDQTRARAMETVKRRTEGAAESSPKQAFGSAFAAARKAGQDTFMFNGKKYTTEMKDSPKPRASRPSYDESPAESRRMAMKAADAAPRGGMAGMAATADREAARRKAERDAFVNSPEYKERMARGTSVSIPRAARPQAEPALKNGGLVTKSMKSKKAKC